MGRFRRLIVGLLLCLVSLMGLKAAPQSQLPSLEELTEKLENTTNSDEIIKYNLQISYVHYFNGDLNKAMKYAREAENNIHHYTGDKMRANVYLFLGNYLIDLSKYSEALENYENAYRLFTKIEAKKEATVILSNMTEVFIKLEKHDLALEYARKALDTRLAINDTVGLSESFTNLGVVYQSLKKSDLAMEYYLKALNIDTLASINSRYGNDYSNLGSIFEDMRDYNTALKLYKKGFELDENEGFVVGQCKRLINISRVLEVLGRLEESYESAQRAVKLAEQLGFPHERMMAYQRMSEIQMKREKGKDGLRFYRLYQSISDSVAEQKQEVSDTDVDQIIKYSFKEGDIQETNWQDLTLNILLIVITIVLFALFFWMYFNIKNK